MTSETPVTIKYNSRSVFDALRTEVGHETFGDRVFDPANDELVVVVDSNGGGRIAVTTSIELNSDQMSRVLHAAQIASGPKQ